MWLLSRYDSMTGENHSELIDTLWFTGCSGVLADGHCHDLLDFKRGIVRSSTRLWPHAEGVRAASQRSDRDPSAARIGSSMLSALVGTFLGRPFEAGWIDHIDESRVPLVEYVPASSLYHLYGAYAELRFQAYAPQARRRNIR
jgi:mannose-6-phosphate isomerase